uniref:NADH-ubiquinone oxidoreductase chain 6 n=1 Tax=Metschnikowia caudata TaxID=1506549 RepID=A0A7H1CNL2_9ASCO|nr:Nad6 [Metschnikowia caudata]QNS23035.1 Nad6 [Metschnikowia caudata]QNS23058.1 Nad6 [Metschnikowia caudata]
MNILSGMSSMLAMGLLSPVQSMLWLMILFVSTALSLYNNNFILMGILYILIYVGAMAILFLFMLSLLKMDYMPNNNMSPLIMGMLSMCFMPLDLCYDNYGMMININEMYNELIMVGMQLYTEYAMLLLMTGMMLMLSVVGAMAMTK